jgi:hypothetical protein
VVSGAFVSLPLGIFCSPISEHYMHEFFGSHVFASFILVYAGIIYVYEVITLCLMKEETPRKSKASIKGEWKRPIEKLQVMTLAL